MSCQCPVKSGYHCAQCCLTFSTERAFNKHLGKLIPGAGYEHKSPEEAGLVVRPSDGKIGLPGPDGDAFWRHRD